MYGFIFIISINKESKVSYSATIRIESLSKTSHIKTKGSIDYLLCVILP